MDPQQQYVIVERDCKATHIALNRPTRGNALNAAMVESLLEIVGSAGKDGTRLLTLRGRGANFCTGFDMGDLSMQSEGDIVLRFLRIEQLLQAIHYAPMHTIAFAHGRVVGAGADLFCACDSRVTSTDAKFRFPGIRFGVVLGTRRLAYRVGSDRARKIVLDGLELDAEAAVEARMATDVLAQDGWDNLATATIKSGLALETVATQWARNGLRSNTRESDMMALVASLTEPGLKERMTAYRESSRSQVANIKTAQRL
jgi:enoyl-CoA hydratase/carnithine racemase